MRGGLGRLRKPCSNLSGLSRGVCEANVKSSLKFVSVKLDLRTLNLSLVWVGSLRGVRCGFQGAPREACDRSIGVRREFEGEGL